VRSSAGLAALVFIALACAMAWAWDSSGHQITDVGLYRVYGERVAHGEVPYRDFDFEYPPGALPVFVLPALVTGDSTGYTLVLAALLAVVGGVGVLLSDRALVVLGRSARERRAVLAALSLSPVLLGALLLARFDLVPAALTIGGLLALLTGRPRVAGLVLGTAIAVKLYPVVILPVAISWVLRRHGLREAKWLTALAVGVPALAYLPFFLLAPGGAAWSIGHQLSRPLQIESLGSGILLAAHHLFGTGLDWASGHGSQNLTGTAAGTLAIATSIVQVGALIAVWWCAVRGEATPARLVRLAAAAVVAFVAFGKVLSPQYLIWLLFLVPVLGGLRARVAGGLLTLAALLTAVWFPLRYWRLVKEFDPAASWLVLIRDLTLAALFVSLLATLSRQRDAHSLDR
jgi:Glycosyltransferase family 87